MMIRPRYSASAPAAASWAAAGMDSAARQSAIAVVDAIRFVVIFPIPLGPAAGAGPARKDRQGVTVMRKGAVAGRAGRQTGLIRLARHGTPDGGRDNWLPGALAVSRIKVK